MTICNPANRPEHGTSDNGETARLFIALWPGVDLAGAMHAQWGVCATDPSARVVPPQKVHLTMHFLGPVLRKRLPVLVNALQVPFQPFELRFSHGEQWPHGLRVAVPDTAVLQLTCLHAALGEVLQGLDLPVDQRPFRPHLTLARRTTAPLPATKGSPLRWTVNGYVLVESQATPSGAYRVLQAYG
jgi:2'-5' RNA ligase